jgi:hypothetical protein
MFLLPSSHYYYQTKHWQTTLELSPLLSAAWNPLKENAIFFTPPIGS